MFPVEDNIYLDLQSFPISICEIFTQKIDLLSYSLGTDDKVCIFNLSPDPCMFVYHRQSYSFGQGQIARRIKGRKCQGG